MKLVNEVFDRYKVNENKLNTYGFSFVNDGFLYKKKLPNNDFELVVEIKNKSELERYRFYKIEII